MQARALPYYRYPLLSFLLPLMAIDFDRAISQGGPEFEPERHRTATEIHNSTFDCGTRIWRTCSAPRSAVLIHQYRWWETDFISSLEQNLTVLGGPSLSRHILCVDSVSGCATVLYPMIRPRSHGSSIRLSRIFAILCPIESRSRTLVNLGGKVHPHHSWSASGCWCLR